MLLTLLFKKKKKNMDKSSISGILKAQIKDQNNKHYEEKLINIMEEKRRRNKKSWSGVAVAVAAILFILPNINEGIANAMGNMPIAGPFFRLMTIREFNYENNGYEIDVKTPNISIESHEGINTKADEDLEEQVRGNVDKVNKDMMEKLMKMKMMRMKKRTMKEKMRTRRRRRMVRKKSVMMKKMKMKM